jgi:hypothetical protein
MSTYAPQARDNFALVAECKEPSDLRFDCFCDQCGSPIYRGESYATHEEDDYLTFCNSSCAAANLKENY